MFSKSSFLQCVKLSLYGGKAARQIFFLTTMDTTMTHVSVVETTKTQYKATDTNNKSMTTALIWNLTKIKRLLFGLACLIGIQELDIIMTVIIM